MMRMRRKPQEMKRVRTPAAGSVRWFQEEWRRTGAGGLSEEMVTALAQLSYENKVLRARVLELNESLGDTFEYAEDVGRRLRQLTTVVEMLTRRLQNAATGVAPGEDPFRWRCTGGKSN